MQFFAHYFSTFGLKPCFDVTDHIWRYREASVRTWDLRRLNSDQQMLSLSESLNIMKELNIWVWIIPAPSVDMWGRMSAGVGLPVWLLLQGCRALWAAEGTKDSHPEKMNVFLLPLMAPWLWEQSSYSEHTTNLSLTLKTLVVRLQSYQATTNTV